MLVPDKNNSRAGYQIANFLFDPAQCQQTSSVCDEDRALMKKRRSTFGGQSNVSFFHKKFHYSLSLSSALNEKKKSDWKAPNFCAQTRP